MFETVEKTKRRGGGVSKSPNRLTLRLRVGTVSDRHLESPSVIGIDSVLVGWIYYSFEVNASLLLKRGKVTYVENVSLLVLVRLILCRGKILDVDWKLY